MIVYHGSDIMVAKPDILSFPQLNLAKIKQHISYMVH